MGTKKRIKAFKAGISLVGIFGILLFNSTPLVVKAATALTASELAAMLGDQTTSVPGQDRPVGQSDTGAAASISNKQQGPNVHVTFSGEGGFQKGTKVTASAFPGGFSNASDMNKLYFTWYLKKSGCDKRKNVESGNKCDKDGDGNITENDWKIEASRIIVRNEFDRSGIDYATASVKDEAAGVMADPEWKATWGEPNDIDTPNCYVQEPQSGSIYELRNTVPVINKCADGFHRACIKKSVATCDVLNPTFTGAPGETKTIDGTADICAVSHESSSNNKTGSDDNFKCTVSSSSIKDFKASLECVDSSGNPEPDSLAMCVPDSSANLNAKDSSNNDAIVGTIFGSGKTNKDNATCSAIFQPNGNTCHNPVLPGDNCALAPPPNFLSTKNTLFNYTNYTGSNEDCGVLKNALINGTKTSDETVAIKGDATLEPTCTFDKDANLCKHLFPVFPKDKVTVDGKEVDMKGVKTGDGKFSRAEKQFWGADPAADSTNGVQKDEAAVMGLGVDKFSWTFNPGDMVGVAVEGTAMLPTDHADSSYRTMWAFSNGTCSALKDIEKSGSIKDGDRGFYVEDVGGGKVGILAANFDLDKCLEENLLEPDDSGMSKFNLALSAAPEDNLVNDPNGGRGDNVVVSAATLNSEDPGSVYYEWSIDKLNMSDASDVPGDDSSWTSIVGSNKDIPEISHSILTGLGKNEFSFSLNFPRSKVDSPSGGNVFYLRVKTKASESTGDSSQKSQGAKILKIYQQKNQIQVFSVKASDTGDLELNTGAGQLCNPQNSSADAYACKVTKNEIIGARIPNSDVKNTLDNFSWTINGNSFQCDANISSRDCGSAGGNVLFFPVLGNENESVDVVATARRTNKDSGAVEQIEVSRHFVIVKPSVYITTADENTVMPKITGYYKDLWSGDLVPDYSDTVFESSPGKTVKLEAVFLPSWKASQSDYSWTIDGQQQSGSDNNTDISFLANKPVGSSYDVQLAVSYKPGADSQINNIRKALVKNWGVSMEDVVETNENVNLQIDMVTGEGNIDDGVLTPWSANLLSHLPEQMLFLLRIVLTGFVMLFVTGVIFSLLPERVLEKREV